jgi:hypothetical protein
VKFIVSNNNTNVLAIESFHLTKILVKIYKIVTDRPLRTTVCNNKGVFFPIRKYLFNHNFLENIHSYFRREINI